ncbi:MAG: LysM peptidoglycan-binding domain-containing protein [Bacteroidetes bacterium]|uniref:LysM peptidoglycan-binding domain-containing protein n=2 Tax=Phaeocystidibacter marisrubri TaxID=1577780 RepID=A0A6L3ZIR1_9FLAO|nr:LysM peptidoglycan-binding domain-containing protein [Phaeocystidibacter marisrubri]TNE29368.1 MAG: LysM peptidoglycan-binding domain-containing protein [Bacteroidota bacterium]
MVQTLHRNELKSEPFFYFWQMRRIAVLLFILITYVSQAQSMEAFVHSKGYLVQGMATLNLESNRTGWWRLSAPVATRYNLEVWEGYDQRMDPIWSTRAAREYWNDLFDEFEDSVLADGAFVYGPTYARKLAFNAMAYLEAEALFEAWKEVRMDSLPKMELRGSKVSGSLYWIDLKDVMGWNQHEYAAFARLNPAMKGDHLNWDEDAYLRFPKPLTENEMADWIELGRLHDSAAAVALHQSRERISKNIPDPTTHERIVYRVRSGDALGLIASRHHVGLSDLKKWNDLRSDVIRVGQELIIYKRRGMPEVRREPMTASTSSSEGTVRSDEEDREEVKYKVKTGDTLWKIAREFPGVSADDIMRWNGINEDIREGQELLILKPRAQ